MKNKYYYNVQNGVRLTSNVQLNEIEKGYYLKKVQQYGPLLESIEVKVLNDNSVIVTAHLTTPQIHLTSRP